jgi:hypothetical protein
MKAKCVLASMLIMHSGQALADVRDDVLSSAARCGAIVDNRQWLDCYYGSAQPMRGQLGLPPAPASQTALVPAIAPGGAPPAPRQRPHGFLDRITGGGTVLNKVAAASYSFDDQGFFTVTLANGQVWRQQDGDQLAHWTKPAGHYLVTVTQGALGSFNLTVPDDGYRYKVRRFR